MLPLKHTNTNTSSNMQYIYILRRPCEISQQNHIELIEEASFIICCFHKREIFWNLIVPSPDPTVVGGDTLTCGECKKDFRLQELTLFIQHKALNTCRYFSWKYIFAQKYSVLSSGERRRQGRVTIRRRRRRRAMSGAQKIEVTPPLDHRVFLDQDRLTK